MFEDVPFVNVDYGKKTCVQAAFIPKTRTILPFFFYIAITTSRFADKITSYENCGHITKDRS